MSTLLQRRQALEKEIEGWAQAYKSAFTDGDADRATEVEWELEAAKGRLEKLDAEPLVNSTSTGIIIQFDCPAGGDFEWENIEDVIVNAIVRKGGRNVKVQRPLSNAEAEAQRG